MSFYKSADKISTQPEKYGLNRPSLAILLVIVPSVKERPPRVHKVELVMVMMVTMMVTAHTAVLSMPTLFMMARKPPSMCTVVVTLTVDRVTRATVTSIHHVIVTLHAH